MASGFNGAPPGHPHCSDVGCLTFEGEGPACKRVVHAEHNAILQNSRAAKGASLYTPYLPCSDGMKAIIAAQINEVVYEKENKLKDKYTKAKEIAAYSGIKLRQIPEVDIVSVWALYYSDTSEKSDSLEGDEALEF